MDFALTHFIARALSDFSQAGAHDRRPAVSENDRLAAAAHWIVRSIDVCGGRASSKGYRFLKGWMPPYPETSGYIIPTLFMLERELGGDGRYRHRAIAIGNWLTTLQLPNGGFCGRELGAGGKADVFDTGMILLGFNALLYENAARTIEQPARAAAEFLTSSLDEEGCFVRHLSCGILHAYNVRSAWSLAAYGRLAGEKRFVEAAMANARWTCAQQDASGYFRNNAFKPDGNANLHGIAYVMRGLLQIYELTGERACLASVVLAADALQSHLHERGMISADLAPGWKPLSRHICLTGYAQLAIVLYRLQRIVGGEIYRGTADRLLDEVARTQDVRDASQPHYGAIAGSLPIYGRYAPLQYPNWATKFFIDALITKRRDLGGENDRADLQLYSG